MSEQQIRSISSRDPAELPEYQRRRRQRIITAALDLIETADYDRVQMRDVAGEADVALGTVYRYFTSKEHLYAAALVEWVSTRPGAPALIGNGADLPERRLAEALHQSVIAMEKWPQIVRTEMQLETSTDENVRELIDVVWAVYRAVLRGTLWGMTPEVADDIVTVCSDELYRSMRRWALGRCSLADVEHHLQAAVGLIFSGPPR